MLAVLHWLYANVTGNLVASAICFIAAWFWKSRPHLRRQRRRHGGGLARTPRIGHDCVRRVVGCRGGVPLRGLRAHVLPSSPGRQN